MISVAYIMTCVEAAVAFIDRLEVSVELEEMASSAYAAFDQQLSAAGLQRNCSCTKLSSDVDCRADNYSQDRLVLTSSNGNLSGMVDDDGVLRVSAGFANQVSLMSSKRFCFCFNMLLYFLVRSKRH